MYLAKLPIKEISLAEQKVFSEKVEKIVSKNNSLSSILIQFLKLLQSRFNIEKISEKLQNWHELEFGYFLKELKKLKIKLNLSEKAKWMQYFNQQKEKTQTLKAEIEKTDREISQIIYELYGLTKDEIKIVEEASLQQCVVV